MLSNVLRFQAIQRRAAILITAILWLMVAGSWAVKIVSDRYSYRQIEQLKKYHKQTEVWNEDKKSHENQRQTHPS